MFFLAGCAPKVQKTNLPSSGRLCTAHMAPEKSVAHTGLALNNTKTSHELKINLPSSGWCERKKKDVRPQKAKQICRTKGLTSADRSNKATLLLTVPRPDSSRLQRIHPRTYHDCNSRTNRLHISVKPIEPT